MSRSSTACPTSPQLTPSPDPVTCLSTPGPRACLPLHCPVLLFPSQQTHCRSYDCIVCLLVFTSSSLPSSADIRLCLYLSSTSFSPSSLPQLDLSAGLDVLHHPFSSKLLPALVSGHHTLASTSSSLSASQFSSLALCLCLSLKC